MALSACGPQRVVTALPTPPERLVCEPAGTRPVLLPEATVDWSLVAGARSVQEAVEVARVQHQRYVASVRTREGIVVGYVMQTEGRLFTCYTNMQWRRDYEAGLRD